MLAKLKQKSDFDRVMKFGQRFFSPNFYIKVLKNDLGQNRFGLMVSLKVDKRATVRNKIRRRFNEILRLNDKNLKIGFDIVISVKETIKDDSYKDIKESLYLLFKKAGLLK